MLEWVKIQSGDWWLFDKPRGTPRHPIATISGFARIGYNASCNGVQFRGKSIPRIKREIEAHLQERGQ